MEIKLGCGPIMRILVLVGFQSTLLCPAVVHASRELDIKNSGNTTGTFNCDREWEESELESRWSKLNYDMTIGGYMNAQRVWYDPRASLEGQMADRPFSTYLFSDDNRVEQTDHEDARVKQWYRVWSIYNSPYEKSPSCQRKIGKFFTTAIKYNDKRCKNNISHCAKWDALTKKLYEYALKNNKQSLIKILQESSSYVRGPRGSEVLSLHISETADAAYDAAMKQAALEKARKQAAADEAFAIFDLKPVRRDHNSPLHQCATDICKTGTALVHPFGVVRGGGAVEVTVLATTFSDERDNGGGITYRDTKAELNNSSGEQVRMCYANGWPQKRPNWRFQGDVFEQQTTLQREVAKILSENKRTRPRSSLDRSPTFGYDVPRTSEWNKEKIKVALLYLVEEARDNKNPLNAKYGYGFDRLTLCEIRPFIIEALRLFENAWGGDASFSDMLIENFKKADSDIVAGQWKYWQNYVDYKKQKNEEKEAAIKKAAAEKAAEEAVLRLLDCNDCRTEYKLENVNTQTYVDENGNKGTLWCNPGPCTLGSALRHGWISGAGTFLPEELVDAATKVLMTDSETSSSALRSEIFNITLKTIKEAAETSADPKLKFAAAMTTTQIKSNQVANEKSQE
ncbi:hypothetical protein N8075_06460, partial [Planktomarina temperata]|nr:hypothetical protein [Planktomarina temperata]